MKKRLGYVSPELAAKVLDRAENQCEWCCAFQQVGDFPHNIHHLCGRKVTATKFNLVLLCNKCHREVHANPNSGIDLELKQNLQDRYYSMGHTEEQVRELMSGRIY